MFPKKQLPIRVPPLGGTCERLVNVRIKTLAVRGDGEGGFYVLRELTQETLAAKVRIFKVISPYELCLDLT